jgi:hypothetical protein
LHSFPPFSWYSGGKKEEKGEDEKPLCTITSGVVVRWLFRTWKK